jgi:RNA 2',3'-cyclic 3'-phosphodiesterase
VRLFLALNFANDLRTRWHAETAPLRAAAVGEPVRWTLVSQLHLTLVFLGEQPTSVIEPLSTALDATARGHPALELTVGGVGAFPNWRRARVLWLAVQPTPGLSAVVAAVASICVQLGLPGLDREFHPHITLGRVDARTSQRSVRALAQIAESVVSRTVTRTSSIDLMASTLSVDGARHELQHAAQLSGPSGIA